MTNTITREDFASAVASAISSVHHLYREVDRLITGFCAQLAEEPDSLVLLPGVFRKAGTAQTRRIIRNEYGLLFAIKIGEDDADEDEDEIEEDGDEPQEELNQKQRKGTPAQLGGEQALLAVRIVLVDPQNREHFEPQVQYAVMNHWSGGNKHGDPKEVFEVRKTELKRVPRALGGADLIKGSNITTKATVKSPPGAKRADRRQLCCVLPVGMEAIPLYDLDSAGALDELVKNMKLMWSSAQSL
jgi:hypothetical protein